MRSNSKGLLTRVFLVVSLLFGVVTFAGTTAEAQFRHRGRVIVQPRVFVYPRTFYPRAFYPQSYLYNRAYYAPVGRVTEGQGYREGLNDGKDDAKHNKGYDPYRHNDYKHAETSAFLDGHIRGYEEGYRQRIG